MTPTTDAPGVPGDIAPAPPPPRTETAAEKVLDRALVEVDLGLPSGARLGADISARDAIGLRAGIGIAVAWGGPAAGVLGVFDRYMITRSADTWVETTVGIGFTDGGRGALGGLALGHRLLEQEDMQPSLTVLGGADLTFVHARAWTLPEVAVAAGW